MMGPCSFLITSAPYWYQKVLLCYGPCSIITQFYFFLCTILSPLDHINFVIILGLQQPSGNSIITSGPTLLSNLNRNSIWQFYSGPQYQSSFSLDRSNIMQFYDHKHKQGAPPTHPPTHTATTTHTHPPSFPSSSGGCWGIRGLDCNQTEEHSVQPFSSTTLGTVH